MRLKLVIGTIIAIENTVHLFTGILKQTPEGLFYLHSIQARSETLYHRFRFSIDTSGSIKAQLKESFHRRGYRT